MINFKRNALSLAIAPSLFLLTSSLVSANTISGRVVDDMGKPVTQGEVQVMGSNKRVSIADDGSFMFTNVSLGQVELHVGSPDYIHSSTPVVVTEAGISDFEIVVQNSSIEVFDVTASAFHASNIESAGPVTVLAGDLLHHQQSATLGDTLRNVVGVHSSFHGGVASTPIIRGLDGPRVLITQNGMDASDASRVGPDHMVATETSSAEQIEVLRGPATLFYGSGAIGGVVNVVDQRIPDNNEAEGEVALTRNTVNAEEAFSGYVKGGAGNFAFSAQGFYRDAENYRIPGFAENEDAHDHEDEDHEDHDDEHDEDHGEEGEGLVESSQYVSKGFTVGSSYLFDQGHVGFSVQHLSSLYGIPGHAHEDEHEEEHDDEDHDEEGHSEEEEQVLADLKQNRYQLAGEFQLSTDAISAINFGLAYTDYQHEEIEDGEPGTRFTNDSFETRIEVLHQPIGGWRGGVSLHTKFSDFSAVGEEAFTPASDTRTFGLGLIEEKHFGDVLVQLGARIERVEIDVPSLFEAELEIHEEGEEHDDHDEDHDDDHADHEHSHDDVDSLSLDFTPYSLSAGAVWDFADGYNLGLSLIHAQRAPSSAELFSFGPHIGTGTYEIGALYELDDEEFEIGNGNFELEESNNIDISLRKFSGDFGFVVNVFYNQVDNYYYGADTGLVSEFSHDHDEEEMEMDEEHSDEEHGHEEGEELPVFVFVPQDASLYGAEFQVHWKVSDTVKLFTQGDLVHTEVDTDSGQQALPRTPPARIAVGGEYSNENWLIDAQVMHVSEQDDVAEFESSTDGYTMVDANVSYFTSIKGYDLEVFAKGRNLTNEEARVHTSFLKDLAPLPGRSLVLGVRANF